MSELRTLSASARRAIFEGLVATAWADTILDRNEILAVRAAGEVLGLPDDALDALDAGPPPIAAVAREDLTGRERRLVYLCAAWLSTVDGDESADEDALLRELREGLGLAPAAAVALRDEARALHRSTEGGTPWRRELEALIERACEAVPA